MINGKRRITDVDEEQIAFMSAFLVELCKAIDPTIPEKELRHRITSIEMPNEKYEYFLDERVPLLTVDLKLLIDGT